MSNHSLVQQQIVINRQKIQELNTSIDSLRNFLDVADEYGVSVPILKAIDPYDELVSSNIYSCENIDQTDIIFRVNDIIARNCQARNVAVEGLVDKIKNFFTKKKDEMAAYEKSINEAIVQFKSIKSFDEDKFFNTEFRYERLDKTSIDKIIRTFRKIYPVLRTNILDEKINILIKSLERKDPDIDKQVNDALKAIGNAYKSFVNNSSLRESFAFNVELTDDGGFRKFIFFYSKGYPNYTEYKLIKSLGFKLTDIAHYAKEAIEIDQLIRRIVIDYDSGTVLNFNKKEDQLYDIAKSMGKMDAFKTISHLVDQLGSLFYFQSVFEPLTSIQDDIHDLLIEAIKCKKE